jgi:hypothetical protein
MEVQQHTSIEFTDTQNERTNIYPDPSANTSYNSLDGGLEETNECFICMEGEIEGHYPIKMTEITSIAGQCKCEAWIHASCYAEWVVENMTCPVCILPVRFIDVDISEIEEPQQNYERLVQNRICTSQAKQNLLAVASVLFFIVMAIILLEVNRNT